MEKLTAWAHAQASEMRFNAIRNLLEARGHKFTTYKQFRQFINNRCTIKCISEKDKKYQLITNLGVIIEYDENINIDHKGNKTSITISRPEFVDG